MRHQIDEKTNNLLIEASNLIKDFTDLGLSIWESRLNNYKNVTTDLPTNLLFRQILEANDGLYELIKLGCINICKPILRTSLDCYLQMSFILEGDEQRKAMHFLYHYNKSKLSDLEKVIFPENKNSLSEKLSKDKIMKEFILSDADKNLGFADYKTLNEILGSAENRQTAKEYGDKKKKSWYHFFIKSQKIEDLALSLKQNALYEILFRNLSSFIHGEDILHSNVVFFPDEVIGLKNLRDTDQLDFLVNSTIIILERSILNYLIKKMAANKDMILSMKPLMERGLKLRNRSKTT